MSNRKVEPGHVSDLCADFVSERRFEPAVWKLVGMEKAGCWVLLRELFAVVRADGEGLPPSLWATWLSYPSDLDYALIVFFDDQSQWSTSAVYNVARLSRTAATPGAFAGAAV
jgi:hypothetical protein